MRIQTASSCINVHLQSILIYIHCQGKCVVMELSGNISNLLYPYSVRENSQADIYTAAYEASDYQYRHRCHDSSLFGSFNLGYCRYIVFNHIRMVSSICFYS